MSSYLTHMLIFGVNVAVIFTLVSLVVYWYVVPFVNGRSLRDGLIPLLLFSAIRVNGLMLLIPGVDPSQVQGAYILIVLMVPTLFILHLVIIQRLRKEQAVGGLA